MSNDLEGINSIARSVSAASRVPNSLRGKIGRAIARLVSGGAESDYAATIQENLEAQEGSARINALLVEDSGRRQVIEEPFASRAKNRFVRVRQRSYAKARKR